MRFSCIKEHFERAVVIAERFTGKNITLPILGNILCEFNEHILRITATNLEYAVQIEVPGKGTGVAALSIPAKIVGGLLQSVNEEQIVIEEKQGNIWIKTETRESRINSLPTEDFPLFPKIKKAHSVAVEAQTLQQGISTTIPAVSFSEFKPELSGVLFRIRGSELRLAATDTFRLAERIVEVTNKEAEEFQFILPQRVAQEIARVFNGEGQNIKITLGDNQVLFEGERVRIVSRIIEGSFPEYGAIIPKSFETTLFLKRQEFQEALRAASIFASKLQDVTLTLKGKTLIIEAANPDVGEYKTTFAIQQTGKDGELHFNYRYLIDALSVLSEPEFFFGLNTQQAPSLIRNKEDASFLYVVMPIRLR